MAVPPDVPPTPMEGAEPLTQACSQLYPSRLPLVALMGGIGDYFAPRGGVCVLQAVFFSLIIEIHRKQK